MKKLLIILLLALTIAGCASPASDDVTYISSVQAKEKVENKESFFLVVGQSTCSGCIAYKPVLKEVLKNKEAEIFYVETDTEAAKSDQDQKNVIEFFEQTLGDRVDTTPTTIYINEGEIEHMEVGVMKYTKLVEWIESKK